MERLGMSKSFLLVVLVFILALCVVYFYLVLPAQSELAELRDELRVKQETLEQLQVELANLNVSRPGEQARLLQVRRQIPEAPYDELFIRDLRKLEVISGLDFDTYAYTSGGRVSPSEEWEGQLVPLVYRATVEGSYRQVERLLQEIESEERIMVVEQIDFQAEAAPPIKLNLSNRDVTASLVLKTFYAPGYASFFDRPIPIDYEQPGSRHNPFY